MSSDYANYANSEKILILQFPSLKIKNRTSKTTYIITP